MILSAKRLSFASAIFAAAIFSLCTTALAQEGNTVEPSDTEADQVLDTVVVQGTQNDEAMAAFRAGDYETAEVEFMENAMCALRRERNRIAGVENIQRSVDRADIAESAAGTNVSVSSGGQVTVDNSGGSQAAISPTVSSGFGNDRRQDNTCEHRGFQIYMAGLSQIQLGKTEDALDSFERATVLSKTLYDAHYKIGLISLLEGDTKEAEKQLKKVEGILARCLRCPARQEIIDRRDHLSKALSGEVSLR